MPTIDNLIILAAVLGVTVDEIIVVRNNANYDGETILKSSSVSGIIV